MFDDVMWMPLEEIPARLEETYGVTVHYDFLHTASMVHIHVPGTLSMRIDLVDDGITYILENATEVTLYAPRDRESVVAGIVEAAARAAAAAKRAKKTTAKHRR